MAIVRDALRKLGRLDPPAGRDNDLRGFVAAVEAELAAAEELRVASLSSDIESAQGATYRGRQAERQALSRARRLGLAECGRPPTSR